MQRPQHQLTSGNKSVMVPEQYFESSNHGAARNDWAAFEEIICCIHTRQGIIYTFDEFKNMLALTMIDIALN